MKPVRSAFINDRLTKFVMILVIQPAVVIRIPEYITECDWTFGK